MRFFPLFLDLDDQNVLVVGGGPVGERKIRLLIKAGAAPHVVGERLSDCVRDWVDRGVVMHLEARYRPGQLAGMRLVFAATDDPHLNRRIHRDAEARGILVNVVDDRSHCRFISPAVIDRDPVQIAISTGGASPVLARRLRHLVEAALPAGLGRVAAAADRLRDRVKGALAPELRKPFWESATADANLLRWAGMGQRRIAAEMRQLLERFRRTPGGEKRAAGSVYLVGAGPGDPGLLTLRALQLLSHADVILHDRLVSRAVLDMARRDAERIYVGKAGGGRQHSQADIERIMVREALRGRVVVRLKGGDPFVFGRGGEELESLRRSGIECEVVPGITAATGCAAAAGIPLTHRDLAHTVSFVTGHSAAPAANRNAAAPDWKGLAGDGRTLVVYMGIRQAGRIRAEMLRSGLPRDLPLALVVDGTRPGQQVLPGTIDGLRELAATVPDGSPGLLIIGHAAASRSNLCWPIENTAVSAAA
jgi:uroporphyrin-III C-methyltransferase/precorrin-2 dehydrogenase/sirohydrochlorin ferrochelatase